MHIQRYVTFVKLDTFTFTTLQLDAAINPGNSGGPVFVGCEVVGVAFQTLVGGDNIGYIIPAPIVELFLARICGKSGVGFCSLGISMQALENHMMREFYRMTKRMSGVLVTKITSISRVKNNLWLNDVLLEIDGVSIEDDGTFLFENRFLMHLNALIAHKKPAQEVTLKILRNGKQKILNMKVMPIVDWCKTDYLPPSYYTFAGFVFVNTNGGVMISQILEANINQGYTSFSGLKVLCVNGMTVDNVGQLYLFIVGATKYVKIELQMNLVVVIDLNNALACHRELLDDHRVIHDMSPDLKELVLIEENPLVTHDSSHFSCRLVYVS